jgi:hypothetical protein
MDEWKLWQKCQEEIGSGLRYGELSDSSFLQMINVHRMMPEDSVYGPWPASGEIDLAECKGNDGDTYPPGGRDSLTSAMVRGSIYRPFYCFS